MRALFLTWDGPQQSYLESLFFPIFVGLQARGIDVHTLQLGWGSEQQLEVVRGAARRFGLGYESHRIPASIRKAALPLAVAYGAGAALRYLAEHRIATLFPRSLLPMGMALVARRLRPSIDLVFDADGFMADERIDFAGWRAEGLPYRLLRRVERQGVSAARAVVCRTEAAKSILIERALPGDGAAGKIYVAPNAKNANVFEPGTVADRASTRARHGVEPDAPWIVYVGSIGPQYEPELMLRAFARIAEVMPAARFSCFTMHEPVLRRLAAEQRLPPNRLSIARAAPSDVPAILAACDLGFALRQQTFSQRGVCPIKVAEYLLCGAPVVASPVGDLQRQLGESDAALLVDADESGAAERIAHWFEGAFAEREQRRRQARELGLRWFELGRCVESYARVLRHPEPA